MHPSEIESKIAALEADAITVQADLGEAEFADPQSDKAVALRDRLTALNAEVESLRRQLPHARRHETEAQAAVRVAAIRKIERDAVARLKGLDPLAEKIAPAGEKLIASLSALQTAMAATADVRDHLMPHADAEQRETLLRTGIRATPRQVADAIAVAILAYIAGRLGLREPIAPSGFCPDAGRMVQDSVDHFAARLQESVARLTNAPVKPATVAHAAAPAAIPAIESEDEYRRRVYGDAGRVRHEPSSGSPEALAAVRVEMTARGLKFDEYSGEWVPDPSARPSPPNEYDPATGEAIHPITGETSSLNNGQDEQPRRDRGRR